jgi:hypothetical protein
VTVVVINKTKGALTSKVALKGFTSGKTAQVWRYSAANLRKVLRQPNVKAASSMSLTFPASSATVIVIPKA